MTTHKKRDWRSFETPVDSPQFSNVFIVKSPLFRTPMIKKMRFVRHATQWTVHCRTQTIKVTHVVRVTTHTIVSNFTSCFSKDVLSNERWGVLGVLNKKFGGNYPSVQCLCPFKLIFEFRTQLSIFTSVPVRSWQLLGIICCSVSVSCRCE